MNNLEIEKEMLSQVDVEGLEKLILHLYFLFSLL